MLAAKQIAQRVMAVRIWSLAAAALESLHEIGSLVLSTATALARTPLRCSVMSPSERGAREADTAARRGRRKGARGRGTAKAIMTHTPLPLLLVADDDRNMRVMLSRMFEGSYRVITAANGAQTLNAVETQHPDVVLVDLLLPDTNGIDLLEPIHASDPHLPVILLTGISKQATADEALARGAFDYVVKPLDDFGMLEDLLARAVEQHRGAP